MYRVWVTFYFSLKIIDGYAGRDEQLPAHFDKFVVQMRETGKKVLQQLPHPDTPVEVALTTTGTEFAFFSQFFSTVFTAPAGQL